MQLLRLIYVLSTVDVFKKKPTAFGQMPRGNLMEG